MNDIVSIRNLIFELRGQRVMLDRDLATLYGVETRTLNQAVKRNIERFPEDFMFQLTNKELEILRSQYLTLDNLISQNVIFNCAGNQKDTILTSQNVISSWGGNRRLPYAFTELGVAMLSSVLRSPLAIQMNIGIMRAFVELRRMVSTLPQPAPNTDVVQLRKEFDELRQDIEDILGDQNDINEDTRAQLDAISTVLAQLQTDHRPPRRPIVGFNIPNDKQ